MMAAITSIGLLWDRLSTIVIAQGFARARTPFDFDQQPDTMLDLAFHMKSERVGTEGYLGGDQAEQHEVSIYLCRRIKRDAWGAARQLKADMDAIESVVVRDYPNYDYVVIDDGVSASIRDPGPDQNFVIGLVQFKMDFDRVF